MSSSKSSVTTLKVLLESDTFKNVLSLRLLPLVPFSHSSLNLCSQECRMTSKEFPMQSSHIFKLATWICCIDQQKTACLENDFCCELCFIHLCAIAKKQWICFTEMWLSLARFKFELHFILPPGTGMLTTSLIPAGFKGQWFFLLVGKGN